MKRGYYIHFQGRTSIGVSKKIDMQMEEFGRYFEMHELEIETIARTLFQRVIGLFPMASITRNYEKALDKLEEPDFIYVRRTVADRAYVGFFREVRRRYPECKILIEIFTYPYDKDDFGKWNAWPFYIKEILYRGKLKKYISRFVTYSRDNEIFGVPTICTTNGINVDSLTKVSGEYRENALTLLGVAYMQRQHGYERVIEGMHEYYAGGGGECKVYLYLVGEGPEKKKYQELVQKYHLEEYVTFYPVTTGKELDELYDRADIALAAFGLYKVGYYNEPIGALKTRECMAKGIPMISGLPIDVLGVNYPYVKVFSNDDSAVNISQVVEFYYSFRKNAGTKNEVAEILRAKARECASNSVLMKPIIDYLKT